jgi:hypothetical protein
MRDLSSDILEPDVIKRVRGGYLAVSKRSLAVRLGAIGETEDQARAAFAELVDTWLRARNAENAAGRH